MTLSRAVCLVALGASLIIPDARAADALTGTLKKIKETGTITLGYRESSVPFSYIDEKQKAVGYSIDICARIVDALQKDLGLAKMEVRYNPVTSATRIPLMANDTIDLECGSTTNNLDREKQVGFSTTIFLTANRFISKRSAKLKTLQDLKGKTIVGTSGTTNIKQINELNTKGALGMTIIPAKDHAEAFLMLETDRAVAFVMDDVVLAGLAAGAKTPDEYEISADALSIEPYAIMMRKDDPPFKAAVDGVINNLYKSGEINHIYAKWFEAPIPPRSINMHLPMSAAFKRVVAKPTDSGDPAAYAGN